MSGFCFTLCGADSLLRSRIGTKGLAPVVDYLVDNRERECSRCSKDFWIPLQLDKSAEKASSVVLFFDEGTQAKWPIARC
jgi:hypothetical protein